jgi:hypothetical protein
VTMAFASWMFVVGFPVAIVAEMLAHNLILGARRDGAAGAAGPGAAGRARRDGRDVSGFCERPRILTKT